MEDFGFVPSFLGPGLYLSILFLGVNFGSLVLVHMYFAYNGIVITAFSIVVPFLIAFMSRKAQRFAIKQQNMKQERVLKVSGQKTATGSQGALGTPGRRQVARHLRLGHFFDLFR